MNAFDSAVLDRAVQGEAFIAVILLAMLFLTWRYLLSRQTAWDERQNAFDRRQEAFDNTLREERIARERLQMETVQALNAMKTSLDQNAQATRELIEAIRDRKH